jgi:ketosteroid isomerase-like protein
MARGLAVRTELDFRPRRLAIRTLDERVALRFPFLFRLSAKAVSRLPLGSRLRRYLVTRRTCQGYEAVNRGDLDVLLAVYHTDVVTCFDSSIGIVPPDLAGEHHGHAGFRQMWQRWRSAWDDLRFEPRELIDAGDRMIVTVDVTGRGGGSGLVTQMRYFELYDLRDGRISRHQNFLERETAFSTAGLTDGEWSQPERAQPGAKD